MAGTDRQVRIIISADVASAIAGMRQVSGGLNQVAGDGQRAQRSTGNMLGGMLSRSAAVSVFTSALFGVGNALSSIVENGLGVEKAMNTFRVVADASDTEVRQFSETARQLGADMAIPGATAKTAGEAMVELSKGGLTANESLKAVKGTMVLAAAASIDGAKAAEIQASALNAFGLGAEQAEHVADVLANTANSAVGSIDDFALALKQTGTVANSFGWSIEETNTVLGMLANAGIKGSDAGTSLKTAMIALINPSKKQKEAIEELGIQVRQSNGDFITAEQLTGQLAAAKSKMTDAEFAGLAAQALGQDAVRTGLVLAQQGTTAYTELYGAVTEQGGAAKTAAANNEGLNGSLAQAQKAFQDAGLAIFDTLQPAMKIAVDGFSLIVQGVGWLVDMFDKIPDAAQGPLLAFGAIMLLNGPLTKMWGSIQGAMIQFLSQATLRAQATGGSMTLMGITMRGAGMAAIGLGNSLKAAFLSNPLGIAITLATTALSIFMSVADDAIEPTQGLENAIDEQTGKLKENARAEIENATIKSGNIQAYRDIGGAAGQYTDALAGNKEALDAVHTRIQQQAMDGIAQSNAWKMNAVNGKAFGKTLEETATAALAAGDAGQFTTAVFESANGVNQRFASDQDIIATNLDNARIKLEETGAAVEGTGGKMAQLSLLTLAQAGEWSFFQSRGEEAEKAIEANSKALEKAVEKAQFFADHTAAQEALKSTKDAAEEAELAVALFADQMVRASGRNVTMEQAAAGWNNALRATAEAYTKATEQGDLNWEALKNWDVAALTATETGDGLYNALNNQQKAYTDTVGAAYGAKAAMGDLSGAEQAAKDAAGQARQAFIEKNAEMLGGVEAAEQLADKLGIVDAQKVDFQILADDYQARKAVDDANNAVIADKNFTINGMVNFGSNATQFALDTVKQFATFGLAGAATGGKISGPGSGTSDSVPMLLSNGEYVINAAQTAKWQPVLEAINNGTIRKMATGGAVDGSTSGGSSAGSSGGSAAPAGGSAAAPAMSTPLPDTEAATAAWAAMVAIIQNAWNSGIAPVLQAMDTGNVALIASTQNVLNTGVIPTWSGISATIAGNVNGPVTASFSAMNAQTENAGDVQQQFVNGNVVPVWSAVSSTINGNVSGPITGSLAAMNARTDEAAQRQNRFQNAEIAPTWSGISSNITNTVNGPITSAMSSFNQVADGTARANDGSARAIVASWATVKGGVADPINWVINNVWNQGVVGMWDKIKGWVPSISISLGAVDPIRMATGGPVSGPGTGTSDSVPAWLSNGEYIVNAAATAKYRPLLDMINGQGGVSWMRDGTPAFYRGGVWDGIPSVSTGLSESDGKIDPPPTDQLSWAKGFVFDPFDQITGMIGSSLDELETRSASGPVGELSADMVGYQVGGIISEIKKQAKLTDDGKAGKIDLANGALAMDGVYMVNSNGQTYVNPLPSGPRGKFLQAVATKMGTSYVWGAAGPDVFDCSGLMSWGMNQAGVGVGRLTADGFNKGYPHISGGKPGDMVLYHARYAGTDMAGHIGTIMDPAKGLMMHTDGAGPARVQDFRSREGGPFAVVDPIASGYEAGSGDQIGELPALIARAIYGDYTTPAAGVGALNPSAMGDFSPWEGTRTLDTVNPATNYGPKNMAYGTMDMVGPLPPGDVVNRWAPLAMTALDSLGKYTPENHAAMMTQIRSESTGDPLAYAIDSNFWAGHPSKGLLQTIPSTFLAHAAPGFNTNLWHPPSNFLAAINYAGSQYGSVTGGFRGVAYDDGGYLQPGVTQVYNGTGKPEPVFTSPQWDVLQSGNGITSPMSITVTFAGDGAITSAMASTARVVVNGAIADTARVLVTAKGQG